MFTIIGAAGNVGSATVSALRDAGAPVRAVLHGGGQRARLEAAGCEVVVADLQEPEALAGVLAGADAVQIVVPLRPATPDPVSDMGASIDSLIAALSAARPPRVLAISDYGAHVPRDIGMPTIFHEFERRIRRLEGSKTILRSAEHMHNLARAIPAALSRGALATFQDLIDRAHPMIAAQDLGRIAAGLLLCEPRGDMDVVHAEGPRRYSASDTAAVLGELAGRPIAVQATPRTSWQETLERAMPPSLAALMMRTNDAKNAGGLIDVEPGRVDVRLGTTGLADALRPLAAR